MNNFRGFTETLVLLKQTNFLVGENSTGKSSFLSLLSLVNRTNFWFNPAFSLHDEIELNSFDDIVSAWSKDKTSFQVGVVTTKRDKSGKIELKFNIHEFTEQNDSPMLSRHSRLYENKLVTLVFEKSRTKYCISKSDCLYDSEEEAVSGFLKIAECLREKSSNLKSFPKEFPPNPPLPIAISILKNIESGEAVPGEMEFKIELPMSMKVTWVAPIRSKPKRIYDGLNISYSPDGEHAPNLLRKSLRSRTSSKKFADRLADFGGASGLFEMVTAHNFGRGAKDPFELLIQFKGAELNINNVGYGVSQVLPLIVEFLTAEGRRLFAVQQPEVHLHPKAQAALGALIFQLAKDFKHSFFIETHSDYLIDRYRLNMRLDGKPPTAQLLFFNRTPSGNKISSMPISKEGAYPLDQPKEFREFFIKEEIKLLDI